jgi:hypothetical protein
MKNSQNIHPKYDRAKIRLRSKIGSPITALLTIQSKKKLVAKRVIASKKPLSSPFKVGNRAILEKPTMAHIMAMAASALFNDGR